MSFAFANPGLRRALRARNASAAHARPAAAAAFGSGVSWIWRAPVPPGVLRCTWTRSGTLRCTGTDTPFVPQAISVVEAGAGLCLGPDGDHCRVARAARRNLCRAGRRWQKENHTERSPAPQAETGSLGALVANETSRLSEPSRLEAPEQTSLASRCTVACATLPTLVAHVDDDVVAEGQCGARVQVGVGRPGRRRCALAHPSHRPFERRRQRVARRHDEFGGEAQLIDEEGRRRVVDDHRRRADGRGRAVVADDP